MTNNQIVLVSGVIGHDSHIYGNKILQYALEKEGYSVISLGIFNSQIDFINAAVESDAKAILISSQSGHAEIECRNFREACIEAGIGNILMYIGGNLAVGKQDWEPIERTFKSFGFNRVYKQSINLRDFLDDLKADLTLST